MNHHDEEDHAAWIEESEESEPSVDGRTVHTCACIAEHAVPLPKLIPAPSSADIPELKRLPPNLSPPYYVPDTGIANGLPRASLWKRETLGSEAEILAQFRMVQEHCKTCFPDSVWSKRHDIDYRDTNAACKHWVDNLQAYVAMHVNSNKTHSYASFAGKLVEPYPRRFSSDTVLGPTTLELAMSWSASKSQTIENGYSLGGSLGLSKGVEVSFSGSYSHSVANTTEFSHGGSISSNHVVEAEHYGRIDIYEISGIYDGHLFVSLEACSRDNDGRTQHNLNGYKTSTTYRMFVFPMRAAVIKAPSTTSAFLRIPEKWKVGTPAPA